MEFGSSGSTYLLKSANARCGVYGSGFVRDAVDGAFGMGVFGSGRISSRVDSVVNEGE